VAGCGLGLYLCRRIVEALGGTIGARCDERGTIEFRIELPAGTP
jgi:signal transduction histidine kinase